jgi:hypothetical protein
MQDKAWAALLSHIPAERHDNLMLVTRSATEIAIQSILRIDRQFVALKGRLAGSQDTGRLFFIPFSEIDYLGFAKTVREDEFNDLFGGLNMPAPEVPTHVAADKPEPTTSPATPPDAEPAAAAPALAPSPAVPAAPPVLPVPTGLASGLLQTTIPDTGDAGRGAPPIRSTVLERFRGRNGV